MLKAAIEKILSLDVPHIEEIEGRTYVDKDIYLCLHRFFPQFPQYGEHREKEFSQ